MQSHHFFQNVLAYLHQHHQAGMWFAFLVAFSESLPIIGTIVPGTITMTIVGVLMGSGALPLLDTLLVTSGAAFCGDTIGYLIGYHYNVRLRGMWPFKNYPKWLAIGEAFFKKHGGKSIILGRFIGPARSTVPLIAGLLKFTWLRFSIAAIPSAVLWAAMYLTPGLLLGALAREIPKAETTRFFIYGISAIVIIFGTIWLIQHFFVQLSRAINSITDRTWHYLTHKKSGKHFLTLITNQQKPADHHPLMMLFGATISALLFLILLVNVRLQGVLTGLNYPVFSLFQSIRTPQLNHFFVFITLLGTPKPLLCVAIVMAIGFFIKKQWRPGAHLIAAAVLTAASIVIFKHLSHSHRPQGFVFISPTSSFPSGHTTISFVVFLFIAFLYAQITTKKYRAVPYAIAGTLITSVAISRLYLGAHWLSDIIGSLLLGTTVLLLCIISYRRMPNAKSALHLSITSRSIILFLSVAIPLGLYIPHEFKKTIENTTPLWPKKTISVDSWWKNPLNNTPRYRMNRIGKPFQPFNVQWQGAPSDIKKILESRGWQEIKNQTEIKSTLARLATRNAQYHMPLLPWLYLNKPPVLVMIKHIPMHERIIELHLWESDVHFPRGASPLLIGAIDIRIPPKILLSLKERTTISLAGDGGLDELFEDTADLERKYVSIPLVKETPAPPGVEKLAWNGKIMVIRSP